MKTLVCCLVFASALAGCAQSGPPRHPGMHSAAKDGTAGEGCARHMKDMTDMKARHERMAMHAAAGASAPHDHAQAPAPAAGGTMAMQGECKMMPKP